MCGRTRGLCRAVGDHEGEQELDAFTVFRVPLMDYLVLPRVLALLAMMPLLTVFADLIGIAGGFVAAMGMLDISPVAYWQETVRRSTLRSSARACIKSVAFAVIVGLTGCLRGLQCGTNAAAVGQATTSAVVTGSRGSSLRTPCLPWCLMREYLKWTRFPILKCATGDAMVQRS